MLIINRSGGLVPAPGAPGQAVHMRDFMWQPPREPAPEQREATLEVLWSELGGGPLKVKKRNGQ